VTHSLSPAIHGAAFAARGIDAVYGRAEVGVQECAGALRAAVETGHGGLSITMPLKAETARLVDDLSPLAAGLGAVNCVIVEDGRTHGANTDGDGCCDALEAAGVALGSSRLGLLGAGGTARAIAAAASSRGAEVVVVNRTTSRAESLVAGTRDLVPSAVAVVGAPEDLSSCDVIVNATSVGLGSDTDSPLDPVHLSGAQVVLDAVYSPLQTPLLASAARIGATVIDGLWMLVHQALRQQRLWCEHSPVEVSDRDLAGLMRVAAERELAGRPR
jgi:shikimate dehydrogenase